MMSVITKGLKEAQDAILKEMEDFKTDKFVTIGIHEATGNHKDDGISNAQLGAVHEYGAEIKRKVKDKTTGGEKQIIIQIPPRPWLNPGVASGNEEYGEIIKSEVEAGKTLDEALRVAAVVAVGKAKQYLTDLKEPALKSREGNPLVDTGAMRASIDYAITSTPPNEGLE